MADGTLKVGTITTSSGSGTITIGQSGETTNIVGTLQNNSSAVATTNGITMANNWRLSSDVSSDAEPVLPWEENDTAGAGKIGSSMTLSSGIFTFPSTGIYLVTLTAVVLEGSNTDNLVQIDGYFNSVRMMSTKLHVINNNDFTTGTNQAIIDVDDVSKTFKVHYVNNGNSADLQGSTDENRTNLVFLRLGDT